MKHLSSLSISAITFAGMSVNLAAAPLEEVIVTAQKRSQTLMEVSASVDAFSESDIEALGFSQASSLAQYSPGLYVKPTVGDQNPVFTIRGIGFNDFTSIQNPGAAVYVNSVVVPYHPMMSFQLLDIEQVEVLKGPQGTLYGRNSTAGAITFVTRRPGDELNGYVNFELGNYGLRKVEAAIGGPLNDEIGARVAISSLETDGYQTNRTTGDNHYGGKSRTFGRVTLDWQVAENNYVSLELHGGKDQSEAVALEHLASFDPLTGAEPCAPVAAGVRAEGVCTSALGYFDDDNDPFAGDYSVANGGVDNKAFGGALMVQHEWASGLVLTSITGYDQFDRYQEQDIDASPASTLDVTFDDLTTAFSQELGLSGETDDMSWIAGVYYSKDSIDALQALDVSDLIPGTVALVTNHQDSTSFAVFSHVEYDLNDKFQIIAGLRYTKEEKQWRGGSDALPLGQNFSQATVDDRDISGMIGIEYSVSDEVMFYATSSKGFRSGGFPGGFNLSASGLQPFDQEEVFAYEIGGRATLMEGSLRLNGALYFYDWRDLQTQTSFIDPVSGISSLVLSNAGDAEIKGAELSLNWQLTDATHFRSGLNYMSTEVVASDDARLQNKDLANAPQLTFNAILSHVIPLAAVDITLQADTSFTDDRFFTSDNTPVFRGEAYWLTNLRASVGPEDESWNAYLWVKNLGDKIYRVEGFNQFGFSGDSYHAYGEPRTYGAGVRLKF